jgi:DNA-binding NtrC family response regulator
MSFLFGPGIKFAKEMKEGKLIIADDNKSLLNALKLILQGEFEKIQVISDPNQLYREMENVEYDLVLLDMNFKAGVNTGNEGIYWLGEIKTRYPQTEVVMITAYGDIELAVKALKNGAADFIIKPWDNEKLIATLKTAYRLRKSNIEISGLRKREQLLKKEANRAKPIITGKSQIMQGIMSLVKKVANTDANVLITGENGTGKELIAKEIHRLSDRSGELFVLVDLSAITETLFESELFGHKKGSFTDAIEEKTGKLQLADKGTLFLDEIGNIPLNLQSKLLTVLQTRVITPVGSNDGKTVNIRLISATNKNLSQMVANNQFRQDLLYRMNTIQIHIPPLRERVEDIDDLAMHFLMVYGRKYNKQGISISEDALLKLKKKNWPGNVRELEHTIEKAVILAENNILGPNDFLEGAEEVIFKDQTETLEEMEKRMIISTLKKNQMNQSLTAEQLGITRQTLYNKIKKYDI